MLIAYVLYHQELFLEKEKLVAMTTDLGFPLPPPSFIRCPVVFFREFEMVASRTECLVARYAFDLDTHTAMNGEVLHERYSQTFMNALLSTIRSCLSYRQYSAQTHNLGVAVLNPFLERIESSRQGVSGGGGRSCIRVDNCLDPDTSINQAVMSARNEISIICEDCLMRYV